MYEYPCCECGCIWCLEERIPGLFICPECDEEREYLHWLSEAKFFLSDIYGVPLSHVKDSQLRDIYEREPMDIYLGIEDIMAGYGYPIEEAFPGRNSGS